MRVCLLNPQGYVEKNPPLGQTDTGGQIVYILGLARALARKGIEVDIVTRKFLNRETIEEIRPNARIIRISAGPNEFLVKEKIYEVIPEMMKKTLAFVQEHKLKYDILHSHYWDGGYLGLLLSKEWKIPHIFTPHSLGKWKKQEMEIDELPIKDLRRVYRYQLRIAMEQKIMNKANLILMISEIQRIKLLQHYFVDIEKIQVIYPGVDTKIFNAEDKNSGGPKNMPNKNRILLVSRFVPAKAIDRAIDIFYSVTKRIAAHLYIATSISSQDRSLEEIEYESKVKNSIGKYKLEKKVTFLGFLSDRKILAQFYKKTDIFLLPSRFEPFGLTAMEALACGAVTLVSKAAGSRELIVEGVNGFIVNMHERSLVAKLIVKILTDKKLKRRISENAAMTIQKQYSWDVISKKIIEMYQTLSL